MACGDVKVVHDFLREARLVLDRFHVVQLYNKKLTTLHHELYHQGHGQAEESSQGHALAVADESGDARGGQRRAVPLEEGSALTMDLGWTAR